MFSNNINCEVVGQCGMSFEKNFEILLKESMTIMFKTNMIWQSRHDTWYNV